MSGGITREWLKATLPAMQAWLDGKPVQMRGCANLPWRDIADPTWAIVLEYRVKPPVPRDWWLCVNCKGEAVPCYTYECPRCGAAPMVHVREVLDEGGAS